MDKQIPYIGSKINLISKSEIRYVGTLYNINVEDTTVALHNVKVYGTEGRRTDGPQIPASTQTFEYVVFKGSDIKDLDVWSPPTDTNSAVFQDPAIVSSSVHNERGKTGETEDTRAPELHSTDDTSTSEVNQKDIVREAALQQTKVNSSRPGISNSKQIKDKLEIDDNSIQSNSQRGSNKPRNKDDRKGRRGMPRQGRRGRHTSAPGTGKHLADKAWKSKERLAEFNKEFDFDSMNKKFEKEKEMAKLSLQDKQEDEDHAWDEEDQEEVDSGYSASSFYDTISSDITDRKDGKNTRMSSTDERKLNNETFGESGTNRRYRRPYRGRYGNRRGRWNRYASFGRGGRKPFTKTDPKSANEVDA